MTYCTYNIYNIYIYEYIYAYVQSVVWRTPFGQIKKIEIYASACYLINFRFRFVFHEKEKIIMILRVVLKQTEGWSLGDQGESSTIYPTSIRRSIRFCEQKSWKVVFFLYKIFFLKIYTQSNAHAAYDLKSKQRGRGVLCSFRHLMMLLAWPFSR